jgi:long-chain fatty acid transport protein
VDARAGGLEVAEQNAVSAATGGAGVARDDDPGAAWHDPAALADSGGLRVGLSLALARPSVEARAADGSWTTDNAAAWQTPPHLDASYAHGAWAGGLALGVPFGGGVTWPQTWPGATQAVQTQLMDVRVAPFVAWRFGALRVAVGAHADFARFQIARSLDFVDTTGSVRMDLTGHGFGVDASAYWAATPALSFGVAYRGATHLALSGPAAFDAPAAFADKTPDQQARTTFDLPDELVVGARYTRGAYAVVADLAYARWSVDPATIVSFASPQTPTAVQMNEWHDTLAARGGVEWRTGRAVVRGGAAFDQSPVPTAYLGPSAPDGDRVALTAGASWRFATTWSVDAFAEQMWVLRRATTSTDTMPASYGGSAIVLGVGVRWQRRP